MKTLTTGSVTKLEEVFSSMFTPYPDWVFKPVIQECSDFKGQNKQFVLAGIGEDNRVVAVKFSNTDDESVTVVIATNSKTHGAPKHAKHLIFATSPSSPWWDPTLAVTVQEI